MVLVLLLIGLQFTTVYVSSTGDREAKLEH
jgi:hypothetical protein